MPPSVVFCQVNTLYEQTCNKEFQNVNIHVVLRNKTHILFRCLHVCS
jgi:hypothetical protein